MLHGQSGKGKSATGVFMETLLDLEIVSRIVEDVTIAVLAKHSHPMLSISLLYQILHTFPAILAIFTASFWKRSRSYSSCIFGYFALGSAILAHLRTRTETSEFWEC